MRIGRQVALLQGINVGRAKRVAMAELRALFAGLGYHDVRTLLNSGNVVFTAPGEAGPAAAARVARSVDRACRVAVERSDRGGAALIRLSRSQGRTGRSRPEGRAGSRIRSASPRR